MDEQAGNLSKQPTQPQEKRSGFRKVADGFKSLSLLFSSIVKILFTIVGIVFLVSLLVGLFSEPDQKTSTYGSVLYGEGPDTIAVIDLSGVILDTAAQTPFDYLTEAQYITPRRVVKLIEKIKDDNNIKAVVFRINSPGGSVTASEEIYQTIKRFREGTNIPVVSSYGDVAASGGYYISLSSDTIFADSTTLTGSIGVIASMLNFQELANEYGVREIAITSGENKNFFSPFQELEDEEQDILQSIVDEAYEQFLDRIRESRETSESQLETLADGRPLTGNQAFEAQLVDEVGTFYDAVEYARHESGYRNAQVVEYTDRGVIDTLFGIISRPVVDNLPFSFLTPYSELTGKPAYLYLGM